MEIYSKCPWIFSIILIYLAVLLFLCLLRAVKGPTIADRLMAGNMMGTIVMVIISILALYLQEGYLMDICLIYAMISFLAVVVLTKVYTGVYLEKKNRQHCRKTPQKGRSSMVILSWVRLALGIIFLLIGMFLFGIQILALFKFRYVLDRMQAAAMGDTLGIGSSLLGLMLLSGWNLTTAKLALVVIFLWCSSPVSSHLIARLEAVTNPKLERKCEVPDEIRKSIEEQNQQRGDV